MFEKSSTKVSLQKVEGTQRLRGALRPLLCVAALGSWLGAGAAYALEVPPEAALLNDVELPVTLNPPGESLVFGADEHCISLAQLALADDAAANVQMGAAEPGNGTNAEPEENLLEATTKGPCIPLATFAAAGEPVFAAHFAGAGFGFGATLSQLAVFAGIPAAIAQAAKMMGKKGGGKAAFPLFDRGGVTTLPTGGGAGGPGGSGNAPPTPTPEPTSVMLFAAGAALVGRAVKRRVRR